MAISDESKIAIQKEIEVVKVQRDKAKQVLEEAQRAFDHAKKHRDEVQTQVDLFSAAINKMQEDVKNKEGK